MARKARKPKETDVPFDPPYVGEELYPTISESYAKKLPKPPFSIVSMGAFIGKPIVAVKLKGARLSCLAYSFVDGLVHAKDIMANSELCPDDRVQGKWPFAVDTSPGAGKTANPVTTKTHLPWLKKQAMDSGATLDAIQLMGSVMKLTEEEEATMAKAATKTSKLSKKGAATDADAGAAPVGGGGKVAETAGKGKGKGNPEALAAARAARAEAGPDTRKIKILNKENPYREGSNRAASFDALKGAKTVEDYKTAGGKVKYLSRWAEEERISLG